jgi:hypothetical protein
MKNVRLWIILLLGYSSNFNLLVLSSLENELLLEAAKMCLVLKYSLPGILLNVCVGCL